MNVHAKIFLRACVCLGSVSLHAAGMRVQTARWLIIVLERGGG